MNNNLNLKLSSIFQHYFQVILFNIIHNTFNIFNVGNKKKLEKKKFKY
jgi:hypothetical protein